MHLIVGLCGLSDACGAVLAGAIEPPTDSGAEPASVPSGSPATEPEASPPASDPPEVAPEMAPEPEQPTDAEPAAASVPLPEDILPGVEADPNEELEAVLVLRDGRRVNGFLVERGDEGVVLRISGIATPFGAELIERIETLPPVIDRYRSLRRAIHNDNPSQLILLSKWLMAYGKYEWAVGELAALIEKDPSQTEAASLLVLARKQAELEAKSGGKRPEGGASSPSGASRAPSRPSKPEFPVLTAEQINLIRVYEIDLQNPPRLTVPKELIDQIIERYAGNPLVPRVREGRESLYRRKPIEIVELVFKLRARELYGMIRVNEHPRALRSFRDDVHQGWLMNACATSACHGGSEAGRLQLAVQRPGSDATVYTNLLILDRFRTASGQPLIRYDDPASSPLLQMALPRDHSSYPHPPVGGGGRAGGKSWRAPMNSPDDQNFAATVRWIKAMYTPRPEYPIEYQPPKSLVPPTDAPAERQPR
jgi:hypothetical protein